MQHRFTPGRLLTTPGARDVLAEAGINPFRLLDRHLSGDWGELSPEDRQANERGLNDADPDRLLSSYPVGTSKVWIITEWDRSVSTILLPSEY